MICGRFILSAAHKPLIRRYLPRSPILHAPENSVATATPGTVCHLLPRRSGRLSSRETPGLHLPCAHRNMELLSGRRLQCAQVYSLVLRPFCDRKKWARIKNLPVIDRDGNAFTGIQIALYRIIFARSPGLGDRRLQTRLTKRRLDKRPHLVAGKIRIHRFMRSSDSILGDYFFIHRPRNGIERLDVRRRCWLERSLLRCRIRDEPRIRLPRGRDGLCSRLGRRMEARNCRWERDKRHEKFIHGGTPDRCCRAGPAFCVGYFMSRRFQSPFKWCAAKKLSSGESPRDSAIVLLAQQANRRNLAESLRPKRRCRLPCSRVSHKPASR
jgi:hypothetical protein